ncbi:EamA family transporter [Sphingobacteriales bacterium UPWRP_1]|nr:hypothetical protein B6N25_01855 [Sphingobacteriales bacterium TSM_CSS]PSJ75195.1 EamA family transporter [Sphingobacteriales bacterium UPWRP_1]
MKDNIRNTLHQIPPDEHRRGMAAVVVASVLWSTGGLFIKLLPFSAFTILFYRSFCAALVFGVVYRKEVLKVNRLSLLASGFYALLLISFVSATKMTTAANAIFLQYTAPVYVLLAEPWLFGLRLQRINIITIIICIAGMALFFSDNLQGGGGWGNIIALVSGVFLAGLLLAQRLNDRSHYTAAIFWGNILVMAAGFISFVQAPLPTLAQAGMLAFLGFVQIGLGYLLFTYGLKYTLAIESALIAMIEPVLNPIWVWIGYGEQPSGQALCGGLIIITALSIRIVITERANRKAFRNL